MKLAGESGGKESTKMTARGWGGEKERRKRHKGFCGEGDCRSRRAALAVEYAGLKQPKGFWVNREGAQQGLAWFVLRLT